jgi:hypothetical protein
MSLDQRGMPRSAERDAFQAGHLIGGVIVFLVLALMLFLVWLGIRGLLERISQGRPICFACGAQAQTQPQTQPQSQPQPPPQPSRHSLRPRPHVPHKIIVDDCLPPGYWGYYSWRLRDRPRRWPVECWRDHRGLCID